MKKFILLSTFLLLGLSIHAKEVFPTSDAIWNMHQYMNGYFDSEIIYGLIGDTVIDNKTYQKMYFLSDTILSLDNAEYVGGFRTQQQQVWFIPRLCEEESQYPEFLLYDFSKEPGEYVEHGMVGYTQVYGPFFDCFMSMSLQRSRVKEVFYDEQGRKHVITVRAGMHEEEWVEGIGSINGFFSTFYITTVGYGTSSQGLACFKHRGKVEYNTNQICNKCFCMKLFTVDIQSDQQNPSIWVQANPQQREIQIQMPEDSLPASLDIYDTGGTLLCSQLLSLPFASVNIEAFLPGTYIYRISRLGKPLQAGKIRIH